MKHGGSFHSFLYVYQRVIPDGTRNRLCFKKPQDVIVAPTLEVAPLADATQRLGEVGPLLGHLDLGGCLVRLSKMIYIFFHTMAPLF